MWRLTAHPNLGRELAINHWPLSPNLGSLMHVWPQTLATWQANIMSNPQQPDIKLKNTDQYRENYANSVQVRVNVWDFFLCFGTMQPTEGPGVEVNNFQGIYLSPQQAKALFLIMQQNIVNYEQAFGEIKLDPQFAPGPVHHA